MPSSNLLRHVYKQGKMAEAVAEVKRLKALEKELGVRGNLQEVSNVCVRFWRGEG